MTKSKTETEVSKVTEEVKKDSRASETREATKRPVEWTPPSSLDAPSAVSYTHLTLPTKRIV